MIICECFNEIILTLRQKKQQKDTRKSWVNYLNLKASTKISKEKNSVYFCFNACDTSYKYIFFTYGAIKDLLEDMNDSEENNALTLNIFINMDTVWFSCV